MPTAVEEDRRLALIELSEVNDALRDDYATIVAGLEKLEGKLPEKCTADNKDVVGDVLTRAKKVEKFAQDAYKTLRQPKADWIERQRQLWQPLAERAKALVAKCVTLSEALLAEQKRLREKEEAEARERVRIAQQEQAAAEAEALSAQTPEAQKAAEARADTAWNATRSAIGDLDKKPVQTKIALGGAVVYERETLDYEITDVAAFAKAHPDLVEIMRGPTLSALREATKGMVEIPETLAGWPGLKLKLSGKTSAR